MTSGIKKIVSVRNAHFGSKQFTIIAGPCSIESSEQFSQALQGVQTAGAHLMRGGIWKLRTSSDSFQGLGKEAFQFLREKLKNSDLGLVSEITDPRQIEATEDFLDIYQVGSRNMHNYALLQELGKTKKPILLKRGFAAHVDEWLKAADYIIKAGNENVILCERGIRTFETSTRNTLDLNSVVYVKSVSNYPVIVDPSHAVGIRALIPALAKASAAAGADGLIIEVHPNPEEALSDKEQALSIGEFTTLMNELKTLLPVLGRTL